jgi:DNA replicative helicase MCM subunit Mcm2 (Cdc46/Mcm family)
MQADPSQQGGDALGGMAGADTPYKLEEFAKKSFYNFLNLYGVQEGEQPPPAGSQEQPQEVGLYARAVAEMARTDLNVLYVDWRHLLDYNAEIADTFAREFYRLEPALRKALQNFVRVLAPEAVRVRKGQHAKTAY